MKALALVSILLASLSASAETASNYLCEVSTEGMSTVAPGVLGFTNPGDASGQLELRFSENGHDSYILNGSLSSENTEPSAITFDNCTFNDRGASGIEFRHFDLDDEYPACWAQNIRVYRELPLTGEGYVVLSRHVNGNVNDWSGYQSVDLHCWKQ